MNLVSTMIGLSVMSIAAPTILDMSISPLIAQKRAINFGTAESAAVVFAAANQGAAQVGNPPNGCLLDDGTNAPAREITCTHGRSKFAQTVSRSFMLATAQPGASTRSFYKALLERTSTRRFNTALLQATSIRRFYKALL